MGKTKLIIAIALFALAGCRKDDDCSNFTVFEYGDTLGWFTGIPDKINTKIAITTDSLTEQFTVYRADGHRTMIDDNNCIRKQGLEYKWYVYRGEIYSEYIEMEYGGLFEDRPYLEMSVETDIPHGYSNYFYYFDEPESLYYFGRNIGNKIRFLPDTILGGKTYQNNYIMSVDSGLHRDSAGIVEYMIINRSYGVLELKTKTSTNHWIFY